MRKFSQKTRSSSRKLKFSETEDCVPEKKNRSPPKVRSGVSLISTNLTLTSLFPGYTLVLREKFKTEGTLREGIFKSNKIRIF